MEYLQLAAALAICALLFYLHRRALDKARSRGWVEGQGEGYRTGYNERRQLDYHQGHEDGLHEGRLKERLEQDTRERKDLRSYNAGYQDGHTAATQEMLNETYTTMHEEVKERSLSA